ncbi:MAG: 4Fe-4S dicluster domain-containing protein [Bacteroidia bacterium]|nr:4Fe-4S dicluster domain-containing protein [Bacteroidia bacterium]
MRRARVVIAAIVLVILTAMFLDYTGTLHTYFSWLAKIQFLPAILAINIGVVVGLIVLTALLGRVYCSVICPLGIMQDALGRVLKRYGKSWKQHKHRYYYTPAMTTLRVLMLLVFIVALVSHVSVVVALFAPYSMFGKIVSGVGAPIMKMISSGLEYVDERLGSYLIYPNDVTISFGVLALGGAALIILSALAANYGRTYCNTICPVGTVLGFISKYSIFKIHIDTEKCKNCGLCEKRCKASCLNIKSHEIDYTRCVTCFDCLEECKHGAISYQRRKRKEEKKVDESKRAFVATATAILGATAANAQHKLVDGGLAVIEPKRQSPRTVAPVPAGAESIENFDKHCTTCQLCITACPNRVLVPSMELDTFMKPRMNFNNGHCRVGCTACSDVCPTGAIKKIKREEKTAIAVGLAVWVKENCIVMTKGDSCGNCSKHCPTGAITMVPISEENKKKIPAVNAEKCIGCGACEDLCPSRPISAIYVEGYDNHHVR